jgi:SAM-dependent methyltransferase
MGRQSVSGPGSEADQVKVIVRELPNFFRELAVSSILDIPCGDFHWMRTVDLGSIRYIGADIVEELVRRNQQFAEGNRSFIHADLLKDELPRVDLVFCRDCLVHLSFSDIRQALRNICASGSRYLLTSHFMDREKNGEINTGEWRPLNLTLPPFRFPPPIRILVEGCTEQDFRYTDKALALWNIDEIRTALNG